MSVRVVVAQSWQLARHYSHFGFVERFRLFSKWSGVGSWSAPCSGPRGVHVSSQIHCAPEPDAEASSSKRKTGSSSACEETATRLENRRIIAKLLALRESDITRVPFKQINEEKALHTLEVLRHFGFSSSSIHLYPELFLMSGGAVENYIRIMQETGFPSVREVFILRFRTVYRQSLAVLQRKVSLPDLNVIVERYCDELEVDDAFLKTFVSKLPQETDKMTLFDLRNIMMACYLSNLLMGSLDASFEKFAKYPRMYYRSFNWVKRNYNILREFGFSNEKIKSHSYLLHTDPRNLSRVTKIKSLVGLDIKKIGTLRPKLLMSTYDTLMDIESSLVNYGIPFESVQKYPEIFTLSADTIKNRLIEMDMIPEFQSLKTHPRVVRLLYYHNKAKARLEEARATQMRLPSLHLLSSDTKRFNRSVATGDFKVKGVDIIVYLSEILQADRQRIRESLVRQPHWLHIPLVNVESVLKFLQSFDTFKTGQLIDALPLLLYPKDKVEEQIEFVKTSGDAQLTDEYFLQMVLYHLERPVHFTGDAVWPEKSNHQEYDEDDSTVSKLSVGDKVQ